MRERIVAENAQKDIENDCREPAQPHGTEEGDDALFEAEALWHDDFVLGLVSKFVERDAEELGKMHEDADVGDTVALLPFGDRFIGIVEPFRKLGLRHVRHLTKPHDIFADDLGKAILIFFHASIISKKAGKVNRSTVSRA